MATTASFPAAHAGEIKFLYGRAETFALKFLEPKVFDGQYGPRGMFTATDDGYGERKIWMDAEDASNMVIELRRLEVRVGEPIRVTKVKHQRGGGHGYLVERATPQAAAPAAEPPAWVTREETPASAPSKIEAQLAQSVQMVRQHGPQVFQRPPAPVPLPVPSSPLAEALFAAVDATMETMVYAARKGLEIAFTTEDIRALAATQFINSAKGGR